MTPAELRALDLEMAEKVMGWKRTQNSTCPKEGEFWVTVDGYVYHGPWIPFHPTGSSIDAMMVLKELLKRHQIQIVAHDNGFSINKAYPQDHNPETTSPTLELAICLFAREVA